MAVIKCKVCGANIELSEDKTIGVCDYCGSTMTLPKIDDEQRLAAFNRGNHFRRTGEFDKALGVYERIVQEDDTDAEAHWCCALCRFGIEYVEDPGTYEWLPTCHRLSFDSFLEDVDYLAALEHSDGIAQRQYQRDAAKIAEVQRGILATSQNAEPFDVFICYKESDENGQRTKDSTLAQDIYYQLTEQGRRVFFARITLEDVAGAEYEPYIFSALNSAKVMIVVGTKREYLNAVWVKNEWSRFLSLMKKDRTKLLLPCYRDMDPYDLPEQLSILQSYDMSKIGFIQDLIRGVNKVLDADKKPEPQVVIQQGGVGNTAALLKRGKLALEDREWEKADGFFEEVLNQDAENAEAYLGKALVEARCSNLAALEQMRMDSLADVEPEQLYAGPDEDYIRQAVERFAIPGYVEQSEISELYEGKVPYLSRANVMSQRREAEESYWNQSRNMGRAIQFAKGELKNQLDAVRARVREKLEEKLAQAQEEARGVEEKARAEYRELLHGADEQAEQMYSTGSEQREEDYQYWKKLLERSKNENDLSEASEFFKGLGSYKDSAALSERSTRRIKELGQAARSRKVKLIAGSVILVVVAAASYILATQVIIPGSHYRQANALLKAGDYDGAIAAFYTLGGFRDSEEQMEIAIEAQLEAYNEAIYAQAEELLANKDYGGAITAFASLGDYNDSAERADAAAEELLAESNKGAAAIAFATIYNYPDARTLSLALWDEVAVRATIATGSLKTYALRSDGTVVVKGLGSERYASDWTDIVAIAASESYVVGLRSDGTVVASGNYQYGEPKMSDWTDIVSVSAGHNHTVGLRADGTVVAKGMNSNHQCDVSDWTDIVAVAAGSFHTAGLRADGTVVVTGRRSDEQRNVSDWTDIVAIAAGMDFTVGLRSDGTAVAAGEKFSAEDDVFGWTDIVAISAYRDSIVGLRSDGTVVSFYFEDDVPYWTDIVAVAAGENHTVGLRADGTVVAEGRNDYGQCKVSDWTGIKLP